MKETLFKNKVEKILLDHDSWFIKYWAGSKYTKEGIPDILACINGKFYGIELKGDNGQPKMLQLIKLRDIRNAKGIGILLYPKDIDRFKKFIEGLDDLWYFDNIKLQQEWFDKLSS